MRFLLIALGLIVLAMPGYAASSAPNDIPSNVQPPKKAKKKQKIAPVYPGSQVIWFNDGIKGEIRPDKTVWWFGVNQKKAIVGDGVHGLKDGQKITTKGGKLTGKPPKETAPAAKKPNPKEQKKLSKHPGGI